MSNTRLNFSMANSKGMQDVLCKILGVGQDVYSWLRNIYIIDVPGGKKPIALFSNIT